MSIRSLHIDHKYFQLASKQLVGMLLVVIVKKSIRSCFSDIKMAAVGAGIMGLMVYHKVHPPSKILDSFLVHRVTKAVPPSVLH